MRAALNSSRFWIAGATVVGLLLVAATYLLVISPARNDAAAVHAQIDDASLAQATLRHKLRDLEQASKALPKLQAVADAASAAIPATPDTQGLLRQVQATATANRVTVDSVAIAEGTSTGVAGVWQLPVTLDLTGAPADLVSVVSALQTRADRALTISGTTLAVVTSGATLTLDVRMFCSSDPSVLPASGAASAGSGAAGAGAPAAGGAAATGTPAGGTTAT